MKFVQERGPEPLEVWLSGILPQETEAGLFLQMVPGHGPIAPRHCSGQ